jgi:hypothetical protein
MGNLIPPAFTGQLLNTAQLPKKGFAGLISDTSLLDVSTAFNDGTISGSKYTRAGTVFVFTGVTSRSNQKGDTATDAASTAGKKVGAVAFSHNGARHPEVNGIGRNDYAPETALNVVNTGRIWMLVKAFANIAYDKAVYVAAAGTTPGKEVTGWVEAKSAAIADGDNHLPGWTFTGRTETDDDGQLIAEVEINRA